MGRTESESKQKNVKVDVDERMVSQVWIRGELQGHCDW